MNTKPFFSMKTKNFLMLTVLGLCLSGCTTIEDNPVATSDIPGSGAPDGETGATAVQPSPVDPVPVPENIDPKDATPWTYNPVKDIGLSLDKSSNYNGHWFGFDGYNSYNASNYDYIWIVYSGNTGVFRFGVTYNPQKSDGSYDYDMALFSAPSGIAYIKLDKTKPNLRNVFTQDDGQEVSMKLEGLWIGTEKGLNWALGKYGSGVAPVPNPGGGDEPVIAP